MSKRILVLDLDTPCFAVAAACERRSVNVKHEPTGKEKVFKTRTEFKDLLKSKDKIDKLDEYSFQDIQEPEDVSHACHSLKVMVNRISEEVQADSVEFCISGSDNFRDNLELPTKYKSNRANTLRPVLLQQVRDFAIKKYSPNVCHFEEADDYIIYKGYQFKDEGYTPIISTIDKDALAYSGLLLYNQDKPERGIVELPQLGALYLNDKGEVKGSGFIWYCHQMLIGDTVDGLKPSQLAGKKFGEKSSFAILKDCKDELEALGEVVDQYKMWYNAPIVYTAWNGLQYEKDWFGIMQMYHKALRMKETEFDTLNLAEFFDRFKFKY